MINYPSGIKRNTVSQTKRSALQPSYANRGMSLEEDINLTNQYYLERNQAIIHKKPTPIQIVKVHYPKRSAATITEGYFQQKSTTDYNGLYKGKYIDFEAKETQNKTSFPLANFHEHQFEHMENIIAHDGISFCLIRFTVFEETYLIKTSDLLSYWKDMQAGGRKSIPYKNIKKSGHLIPLKFDIRVDYLPIIDQLFFENGGI